MAELSIIIWAPLVGAVLVLLTRSRSSATAVALVASLVTLAATVAVIAGFDRDAFGYQLVEAHDWLPAIGVQYKVGIDGISVLMVLLTALLTPIVIATSWLTINKRVKEYMAAMLVLETGMLGVFLALDLVLFYVFWELVLIPMYLIIGVWGGPNRVYATVKFFLFTFIGSVLMLVAILAIYFNTQTFDVQVLPDRALAESLQGWVFVAFFLAFAIKVPMFPFHTWLPDAHVEAPTGGSVILAGVLLKMGGYGFIRYVLPLTPNAVDDARIWMMALSVIAIIYGALVAMMQRDLKKLIAYSSVSHMGFVTLGIFSQEQVGVDGAIIPDVQSRPGDRSAFPVRRNHLRTHPHAHVLRSGRNGAHHAGLRGCAGVLQPCLAGTSQCSAASRVSSWSWSPRFGWQYWSGVLALTGVVLAAAYMLWMYQRVMLGQVKNVAFLRLPDMNRIEVMALAPVAALVVFVGVSPGTFVDFITNSTARIPFIY